MASTSVVGRRPSPITLFRPSSHPHRVLSIQSTVVYGYVGNRVALYALQLTGWEADGINSCELSNHTGYEGWAGRRGTGEELRGLLKELKRSGMVNEYGALLSGYLSNVDFMKAFVDLLPELTHRYPHLPHPPHSHPPHSMTPTTTATDDGPHRVFYLLDPVLGDQGKLYVPAEFVELYQLALPFADMVTPNATEAELLTGLRVCSEADAMRACRCLHEKGPKMVVITSIEVEGNPDEIAIIASEQHADHCLKLTVQKRDGYWSGTGDLTSALLLSHYLSTHNLQLALDRTMTTVQAVMANTYKSGESELQLIRSMEDIRTPDKCTTLFKCVSIPRIV